MSLLPHSKLGRRELGCVAVLTLVGAVLRFYGSDRLGLTHFDEGIYAIAGFWSLRPDGLYGFGAESVAYAPPGFPILVGLMYALLGPGDGPAILVSQLAAVATIPAVAWVGRKAFGPGAGGASAAFAALSAAHVAFARTALTDATFLLAWVVGLGLGIRFLERPRLGRAIAFGLAVGLAQNVKYNGAMIGLIVAAVALLDLAWPRSRPRREALRAIGLGLVAALVAAAVYWPWFDFVERHGGYRALLAHHRGYVGDSSGWVPRLVVQLAEVVGLSGGPGWRVAAWALGWTAGVVGWAGIVTRRPIRLVIGLLAGSALLALAPDVAWWLGLAWTPWLLADARPGRRVVGAWWLVMSLVTPFYHPYARLWLPLHAVGWILLGGTVAESLAVAWMLKLPGEPTPPARRFDPRFLGLLAAALVAVGHRALAEPRPRPLPGVLDPTDSYRDAADRIAKGMPRAVHDLRVLVRPPLLYYLAGQFALAREPNAEALFRGERPGVFCLIEEEQLRQEGPVEPLRQELFTTWEPITSFPLEPGLPALLDEDPGAAFGDSARSQDWVWVVRSRSEGPRR